MCSPGVRLGLGWGVHLLGLIRTPGGWFWFQSLCLQGVPQREGSQGSGGSLAFEATPASWLVFSRWYLEKEGNSGLKGGMEEDQRERLPRMGNQEHLEPSPNRPASSTPSQS